MISKFFKKIELLPDKSIGLILFMTALILRFGYSIYAYHNNVMESFVDDLLYYNLGKAVLHDGPIFYNVDFHSLAGAIGPGLPWINAATFFILGESWLSLFFVTSLVSSLITLLTFKVACLVIDKQSALLAGIWSCFYYFYYMYSARAGKDIWMSFFLLILIFYLIKLFYLKKYTKTEYLVFILLYVFSFHLDERFLFFAPFIMFYILFSETSSFTKFTFRKSFIFLIMVIILMIPWSIRNYVKYDKFILLTTRTEHITDKLLGYDKKENIINNADLKSKYYIHDYQVDSIISGLKTVTDGGYKITEKQRQAMKNGKLPSSFSSMKAFWVKFKDFLRPFQIGGEYQMTGYFYYEKSVRHNIASFLSYGIMFLFSVPGFFFLYKKNRNIFYLFFSTIAIYALINSFLSPYASWRYRLPLDALFIIVGCFGVNSGYNGLIAYKQHT